MHFRPASLQFRGGLLLSFVVTTDRMTDQVRDPAMPNLKHVEEEFSSQSGVIDMTEEHAADRDDTSSIRDGLRSSDKKTCDTDSKKNPQTVQEKGHKSTSSSHKKDTQGKSKSRSATVPSDNSDTVSNKDLKRSCLQ